WDLSGVVKDKSGTTGRLSSKELEALWDNLSSVDAALAYQAEAQLMTTPKHAVAFFQDRLGLKAPPDVKGIPGLLTDLDADDFIVREKAAVELQKLGEAAKPALQKALKGQLSIEAKRRIQQLLDRLEEYRLQPLRALEVLERLDTPETQQL